MRTSLGNKADYALPYSLVIHFLAESFLPSLYSRKISLLHTNSPTNTPASVLTRPAAGLPDSIVTKTPKGKPNIANIPQAQRINGLFITTSYIATAYT